MRSLARDVVFKVIFSRLFNQADEGLFDVCAKDLNENDKEFAKILFNKIVENEESYSMTISKMANHFKYDRIFNADKCAIFIGMAELDFFPDTPKAVVIDEAVKLSYLYSTEKSTDFVNGILASYSKGK